MIFPPTVAEYASERSDGRETWFFASFGLYACQFGFAKSTRADPE